MTDQQLLDKTLSGEIKWEDSSGPIYKLGDAYHCRLDSGWYQSVKYVIDGKNFFQAGLSGPGNDLLKPSSPLLETLFEAARVSATQIL